MKKKSGVTVFFKLQHNIKIEMLIFIIFVIALLSGCSPKPPFVIAGHITEQSVSTLEAYPEAEPYPYYLLKPEEYDKHNHKYPLLIFLHGAGELSDELKPVVMINGPCKKIFDFNTGTIDQKRLKELNLYVKSSFVIYPQSSSQQSWKESIEPLISKIVSEYPVDTNRIYLTGLSLGGGATWDMAALDPKRYAAIVPVCGYSWAIGKETLAGTPIWAFHAFDDKIVQIDSTTNPILEMILGLDMDSLMKNYPHQNDNKLKPADKDLIISFNKGGDAEWREDISNPAGQVNYTLYKNGGHDSWSRAYDTEAMWKWLYNQSR